MVILVYDITNRESFTNIENNYKTVIKYDPKVRMILIGNKNDLNENRKVSEEEGRILAHKLGIQCREVSAKKGAEIQSLFQDIAKKVTEPL